MATENITGGGKLFDRIIKDFKLKNDAALARFLEIAPPVISKIRHGARITADMILIVFDKTGYSIPKIRELIAS